MGCEVPLTSRTWIVAPASSSYWLQAPPAPPSDAPPLWLVMPPKPVPLLPPWASLPPVAAKAPALLVAPLLEPLDCSRAFPAQASASHATANGGIRDFQRSMLRHQQDACPGARSSNAQIARKNSPNAGHPGGTIGPTRIGASDFSRVEDMVENVIRIPGSATARHRRALADAMAKGYQRPRRRQSATTRARSDVQITGGATTRGQRRSPCRRRRYGDRAPCAQTPWANCSLESLPEFSVVVPSRMAGTYSQRTR